MGKFGILGSFQAYLAPQKIHKNQNEAKFRTITPRNVLSDAGKPNGIIVIPLGNHTELIALKILKIDKTGVSGVL